MITIARMKIENPNWNWLGVDHGVVGAEERAGHPAEGRAHRVGEQLGAHQRDAHRHRGDLVLAQRDPRPAEPRVAHPQVDEEHDQQDRRRSASTRAAGRAGRTRRAGEVRRVDGGMPRLPAVSVIPPPRLIDCPLTATRR